MESMRKVVDFVQNSNLVTTITAYGSPPSTSTQNVASDESVNPCEPMTSSNLLRESYLTLPEEILSMTSVSDLKEAVDQCKAMVLERPDDNDEKKLLIRRLIELRLRLHHVKEAQSEEAEETFLEKIVVLGHHFTRKSYPKSPATHYCDRCSGVIWNPIHSWHLCTDCNYKCHLWCLNQVCRVCAHVSVSENPTYIMELCPEKPDGLAAQNYRCAECLCLMSFGESVLEPRRCDYNGEYYCPTCHWNSTSVIPSRIIQNWDFTERKVCRRSKQILSLLASKPIMDLEKLNPVLFASVCELIAVKSLRHRLLLMKKYLTSCKMAVGSNILWQLRDRLHFMENTEKYSMQDLIDLRAGTLMPYLHQLMGNFEKHITQDCTLCKGQGYFCEMCKDNTVIYPFGIDVECCLTCGSAYHSLCWIRQLQKCPKCKRKREKSKNELS